MNRKSKGFSLVETVLAVGIMGLAITALLGLLPHGIETTRLAAQENAYARILDSVKAEIFRIPFSQVPTVIAATQRLSYDEQGNLLRGNAGNTLQSYMVEVDFQGNRNTQLTMTPAAGGIVQLNKLHYFDIRIAATSLTDYSFRGRPVNAYRTFSIYMGS